MTNIKKQNRNQTQRFIEKARELGCDEDEAAFDARLRKIAKATPSPAPEKKKPKR
jgi:hypothetical protein